MDFTITSGGGSADQAQLQKVRDLLTAPASTAETKLLVQAVLDLSAAVSGLQKAADGQEKKRAFRVGG